MAGTIELNGQTYELRFTAYSMHKLAIETSKGGAEPRGLSYFFERLNGDLLPYSASYIIWTGLVWNPKYSNIATPEAVARALPIGEALGKLMEQVLLAFSDSVNEQSKS